MQPDQDEAAELRRRMANHRQLISRDVAALVQTVHAWTEWRSWLARHSWSALGVAALAGYLVTPKRRPPVAEIQQSASLPVVKSASSAGSMIFRTLASFATRAAIGYLQKRWAEARVQEQKESNQHTVGF
jgi:hypothetical protein